METQGAHIVSLLPGLPQTVAQSNVLPAVNSSPYSKGEAAFFEIFKQLSSEHLDQPVFFSETSNQTAEILPLNPFSLDIHDHSSAVLSPLVNPFLQDEISPESEPETVPMQGNATHQVPVPEKGGLQSSSVNTDLKTSPVYEPKENEITAKKINTDHSTPATLTKTNIAEQANVAKSVHHQKISYPEQPPVQTYKDQPIVQSHTVAQTTVSDTFSPSDKKNTLSNSTPGIPVIAGLTESQSVAEPVKPAVSEAGLQSTVKQSAPLPEVPFNRLGQTLLQLISKGEQKLEFRLDPPELGKLTMTIAMERDSVSVQMLTGSQAVKDLLLTQVDRLRTALADESLTLGQMSVDISDQNTRERHQAAATETLLLADGGSESGKYQTASVVFKAQGGRLLDQFV